MRTGFTFGAQASSADPLAELEAAYNASHAPNEITDWQRQPHPLTTDPEYPYAISVRTVQCALNAINRGSSTAQLAVDGVWGPQTRTALFYTLASAEAYQLSDGGRTVAFRSAGIPRMLRERCPQSTTPQVTPPGVPAVQKDWTTWLLLGAVAVAAGTIGWVALGKKRKRRP